MCHFSDRNYIEWLKNPLLSAFFVNLFVIVPLCIYRVSFVENNFTVYQDIMASDEDADNNGQLTYRIVSGNMFDNDTHFEIETLENGYGRLKPKRDLNRESME